MYKIGITGATGTLGMLLCEQLKSCNIECIPYREDIRNHNTILNWLNEYSVTHIIHLAAIVPIDRVNENPSLAYDVNVNGTIQLLKAIQAFGKPVYLFYSSTSHIYREGDHPLSESSPVGPQNTYGLTKYISELLLQDFEKNTGNITVCIGRIFSFYHASQKPPFLYANLMKRFREEDLTKPFKLSGAQSVRDFLDAETVCDLIIQLIRMQASGIYNIASGNPISIKDFAQAVAPSNLTFDIDYNEKTSSLIADISKLKNLLQDYGKL
jgi:nucleoside-diphosphate-sugar epimerase